MRFDHGSGKEFWTTWWPHNGDEFNTPEFKAEFQSFVDELRGSLLKDRSAMSAYCYEHAGELDAGAGGSCGYIAESEKYRYCLRCTPRRGDYSYIYIYDKRQQALRAAKAERSFGLTEKGKQALLDAADPSLPHRYNWFVVENFDCNGEQRHDANSLTDAIDRFNGLDCEEKRLCVTKDDIATIYLAITHEGKTHLDEGWADNPRFAMDSTIQEAAQRLKFGIAGLEQSDPTMTLGGMK